MDRIETIALTLEDQAGKMDALSSTHRDSASSHQAVAASMAVIERGVKPIAGIIEKAISEDTDLSSDGKTRALVHTCNAMRMVSQVLSDMHGQQVRLSIDKQGRCTALNAMATDLRKQAKLRRDSRRATEESIKNGEESKKMSPHAEIKQETPKKAPSKKSARRKSKG